MTAMASVWNNSMRPRTASAAKPCTIVVLAVLVMPPFGGPFLRGEDDTVVDAAAKNAGRAGAAPQLIVLDQQMDGMFFQGLGNAEQARQHWLGKLTLEVSALDGICRLSAAQRAKCETAARLDVARVMDDIEAVRRRYAGRTIDMQNPAGQAEWQRFSAEGQALLAKRQDVGGEMGLLARVIAGILDETQRSAWQRESASRERSRWQSVVDAGMLQLDLALGLTSAQHDAIRGMLMDKPLRINHAKIWAQGNGSHFAPFVCRYGLTRLDQAKLKALLNERQWKTLGQFIDQGRGMATHLKQQKMILD